MSSMVQKTDPVWVEFLKKYGHNSRDCMPEKRFGVTYNYSAYYESV